MAERQKESKLSVVLDSVAGWAGILGANGLPTLSYGLEQNNDSFIKYGIIASAVALTSALYIFGYEIPRDTKILEKELK